MLKFLRKKKTQKKLLIGLACIIIPAFVLWGSGGLGKKGVAGGNIAGTIGHKKIGFQELFYMRRGVQLELMLSYLGRKELLDKILQDRELMNKLSWDRLVMLEQAKRKGVTVKDEEVVNFIVRHPLFMSNGAFNEKFYTYVIETNMGITTRVFEEHLRNSICIAKLKDEVIKNVAVTEEEVLNAYKKENEKSKITYFTIPFGQYVDSVPVQDNEINDYYAQHKEDFIIPAKIKIRYISFPYSNLSEKGALRNMVIVMGKKAIKDPETLESIALENGIDITKTEFFDMENIPEPFVIDNNSKNKLFKMTTGTCDIFYDDAVRGFIYIVQMLEKEDERALSLEESEETIIKRLKYEKSLQKVKNKSEELVNSIKSGSISINDAAAKQGVKLVNTDLISRSDYLEGVGEAYSILDNIFSEKKGSVSGPYITRKGYMTAVLDEFAPIDKATFEKEKENYQNKVLSAKKQALLTEWFADLTKDAKLYVDLKKL